MSSPRTASWPACHGPSFLLNICILLSHIYDQGSHVALCGFTPYSAKSNIRKQEDNSKYVATKYQRDTYKDCDMLIFTILGILYLTSNLMQVIQVYTWLVVTHDNLRCLKPLNLFLEILRSCQWSDSWKPQPTTCMVCPNYSLFHISAHIHSWFHST